MRPVLTRRSFPWLVAALLGLALAVQPVLAAPKPKQGIEFTFEIRARDTRLGSGRLLVGPKSGSGAKAQRLLQLSGQTESLLGALYQGTLLAHSWVDPQWVPVAARWTSAWAGRQGSVQALLGGGRVRSLFERQGRGSRQQDVQVVGFVLDPVSLVPWIMQQKPKPGQAWSALFFTGSDLCKLEIQARAVERLRLPQPGAEPKETEALRFEATLGGCRIQRSVTAWTATADQQPLRVVLHDKLLGDIYMDHTATARVAMPEVAPPPKEPLTAQVGSADPRNP